MDISNHWEMTITGLSETLGYILFVSLDSFILHWLWTKIYQAWQMLPLELTISSGWRIVQIRFASSIRQDNQWSSSFQCFHLGCLYAHSVFCHLYLGYSCWWLFTCNWRDLALTLPFIQIMFQSTYSLHFWDNSIIAENSDVICLWVWNRDISMRRLTTACSAFR